MAKMAKLVSTSFATDEATKMLKVNDTGSRPELRTASALQVRVALYAALCLFTAWAAPEYTSLNWMHPRSSCVQLLQYERPGAGVVSIVVSSSSTPKEHMLSYDLGLCGVMAVFDGADFVAHTSDDFHPDKRRIPARHLLSYNVDLTNQETLLGNFVLTVHIQRRPQRSATAVIKCKGTPYGPKYQTCFLCHAE